MKRKIGNEDKLSQDIIASTKAIREKFKKLKLTNAIEQEDLNRTFKPIIEPLKKIINLKKAVVKVKKYSNTEDSSQSNEQEQEDQEQDEEEAEEEEEREVRPIDLDTAQQAFGTTKGMRYAQIHSKKFGVFAAKYVLLHLQPDKARELDKTYGIRADGSRWLLGDSNITIKDDIINVANEEIKGSPGLFELLFMKEPDNQIYTNNDLAEYKNLLIITNAHKQRYDFQKQMNSNRGYKYTTIIKPLFSKSVHGNGMTANKARYEYWDNPNELVDRLRLLVSSQAAGNNSHQNEIHSIVEELREAKYIE
jgi:hypothetical protein